MITTIALILAATALRPHGAEATPRDVAVRPLPPTNVSSVTIAAMPYARTVTCGSYTLTGTFTGATPTWSASPSGASGSCSDTGGGTFSCVVDVDPDATGEGVETITVTTGSASDTETIGFYVDGEHSCFLAQSVDGSYNSTLANLDAVTTWENLGSSALDVTQSGAATLKPTFRTSIVGGNPIVRCDGGDRLFASTASDWTFLHNGTDVSVGVVSTNANSATNVLSNKTTSDTAIGARVMTLAVPARGAWNVGGGSTVFTATSATLTTAVFHLFSAVTDDDGGAGADGFLYVDGATASATAATAYSSSAASPIALCSAGSAATGFYTGDIFRVLIYQSALTSTQRGINKAVDEWALGGTLPVTP